jgi:hypothetical protein
MKYSKIFRILAIAINLSLLAMVVMPATPALAQSIELSPTSGIIGTRVTVTGSSFHSDRSGYVYLYFGDSFVNPIEVSETGTFTDSFHIPRDATPGESHHVTVRNAGGQVLVGQSFNVLNIEIKLDPEVGHVGTEVEISGEGFLSGQKITTRYDGDNVDAVGGNETDSEGRFTRTIIIPESLAGNHVINVTDESGNELRTEFGVEPKITIDPISQAAGKSVEVSFTGFGDMKHITLTFNGDKISTMPTSLRTNRKGSVKGSFLVPIHAAYGISKVGASDDSFNVAEAQLTILATPAASAGISLSPTTSLTSPGHVGMELNVRGTGFVAETMVTVTYDNDEAIAVATAATDASGSFLATFIVPPSIAGRHIVAATDGAFTAISTFTMESEVPPMPVPLLPKAASTAEEKAYFDWEGVTDPSGVTYILQIGTDADFTTMVLEKNGLPESEYMVTGEERLTPIEKKTPYYWRVKAVDDAFNESEWTPAGLFYVGFTWASIPSWVWYTFYGLCALLLGFLGFWVRKRAT